MADTKISAFAQQTDLSLIDGLAGYEGATNKRISGANIATSLDVALTKTGNSTFIVEVKDVEDFPGGTGLGATISLAANTTYIIRGEVDILLDTIDVQVDNSAIIGFDRNKDILKASTLVGTMITVGDPTLAIYNEFNFTLDNIGLQVPLGRVLEAENINSAVEIGSIFGRTKVLQISNCEIKDTLKVWTIIGFELVDLLNNLIWFIDGTTSDSGCQFKSVRHLEINSCEVFNWTAVVTNAPRMLEVMADNISTAGGLVSQFNAVVNIAGCIIHPINDQIGLYIDSASETKFGTVAANTFIDVNLNTPTGKLFDPLPSTGGYSLASTLTYDIGLNQGIPNSIAYAMGYFNGLISGSNPGSPTLLDVGTGFAASGVPQRFTIGNTGIVTYSGTKNISVQILATISIEANGNDVDAEFGIYKAGTLITGSEQISTFRQDKEGANIPLAFFTNLVNGDTIEVRAELLNGTSWDLTSYHLLIKE